jgi:hypothetical protein
MSDGQTDAIKFVVRDAGNGVCAYPWRIWPGNTSFYLKPLNAELGAHKVSLHGPDERHPRPGFSFAPDASDRKNKPVAEAADGLFTGRVWFPGREVNRRVRHVVRIRVGWDMFTTGSPSAVLPNMALKRREYGALIEPARLLRAMDVDLFVCRGQPYWPRERRARADEATLGPLANKTGQYLTGVIVERSLYGNPPPSNAFAPEPANEEDRLRGLGVALDPTGFLWVLEQWMSKSTFPEAFSGSSEC